jgi:hypothetical protein
MAVTFDKFNQPALRPITGKEKIAGGQVIIRPHDKNKYFDFGAGEASFTPNVTDLDIYTPAFGDKRLIGRYAVTKEGTIEVTLHQHTKNALLAMFMSGETYVTQTAVATATMAVEGVKAGDTYRIPGMAASITSITDGAEEDPEALVAGTHYTFHKGTGFLQIIALPEGFGDDIEITYTLPAITEEDQLLNLGMLSSRGLRCEVSIVNVIADGNPGVGSEATFWDVEFKPNGAIPFIQVDAENNITLTGTVYADPSKPVAMAYGRYRSFAAV